MPRFQGLAGEDEPTEKPQPVVDVHPDGNPEAATLTRSDGCAARHQAARHGIFVLMRDIFQRTAKTGRTARARRCWGVGVPGRPGPPISLRTDKLTLTEWSVVSDWPLRPPVLMAVAVTSGLIMYAAMLPLFQMRQPTLLHSSD
jgi:hypothetical protein